MPIIAEFLLKYIAAPVLIGIACFFFGMHLGTAECEAAQAKAQLAATKVADKHLTTAQTQDAVGAAKEVDRETTVREINNTVPQIIDHDVPVYSSTCLDTGGVRALTSAVAAANGRPAPSGPDGNATPVPAAPDNH